MPARIEDYALIGDCHTVALISKDGSLDWLCFPRFDSAACFAALLGTPDNGRWLLAPAGEVRSSHRHYRDDTLILETDYRTADGEVTVIDFMPVRSEKPDLVRTVVGKRGAVAMHTEIAIRFDYGSLVPWVRKTDSGISAIAGPDTLELHSDVPLHGKDFTMGADFTVSRGQRVSSVLTWHPSFAPVPKPVDPAKALRVTEKFWNEWSGRCTYKGEWEDAVLRSLITLKALTYAPTGGIVAAATTSLPEQIGSVRNWDYRYCWVRDSTFTLYALMLTGYLEEATAWREWLLARRRPGQSTEPHVWRHRRAPSHRGRTGLAARLRELQAGAHRQRRLQAVSTRHLRRGSGLAAPGATPASRSADGWRIQREMLEQLETKWHEPDEGIWEVRGPRRNFTHSKMMAWVALDRSIRDAEKYKLEGPLDCWRKRRDTIHAEVCAQGVQRQGGRLHAILRLEVP